MSIQEVVPEEHREWLTEKLRYSHEPSLRQRLRELLSLHDRETVSFTMPRDRFVSSVVSTRNYLTHYDEGLEEKASKAEALFYLTERLRALVAVCLLSEIGFNSDQILQFMTGNSRMARQTAHAVRQSP